MRICFATDCSNFVWGTCKITREGYCKNHQHFRKDYNKETILQRAIKKQKQNALVSDGRVLRKEDIKLVDGMEKQKFEELQQWYKDFGREIEKHPYCRECELNGIRTFIPSKFYRAASAHLLAKRKEYGFPSISTHPLNRLVLSASCGHHGLWDRSWEDASSMKIFAEAVPKFIKIYPSIAKSEHKNIPECLLQYLEPETILP